MSNDWRHAAACRETDPELHFPVGTTGVHLVQVAEAKAVCASCPALKECLEWALDNPSIEGIWGGLTDGERRNYRRRQLRAMAA